MGGGDAGEDFQQGAFAGAVAADDADDFALFDFEIYVAERPEVVRDRLQAVGLYLAKDSWMGTGWLSVLQAEANPSPIP